MTRNPSFNFVCRLLPLAVCVFAWMTQAAGTNRPASPNILFAIADDWGFGHAGAYGCQWVKTPAFDRVARQGLLFMRTYTPNAKCAPSRACILTGRNSWELEAAANHWCYFPPQFKTSWEALSENGYFAGYTAKGWAPGVATNALGDRRLMTGWAFNKREADAPARGIANTDYAANFRDFLDAAPTGQPWCFWYGCYEPHRGYEYGAGVAKGGMKTSAIDRVPAYWPDNEFVRNDLLDYAFEVENYDHHLGRMLNELEQRGMLSNTIVVATSDNGMPFPRAKGQEYDFSNHLPLAIMWPEGVRHPGRVIDDFVSFIDFAPTFIEMAGLTHDQAGMAPMSGRSLTDILFDEQSGQDQPVRDHVLIGKERHDVGRPHDWGYPIRGIVEGDWIYLRNFETNRWPAGDPVTGYLNCDGGPTKSFILAAHRTNDLSPYWALSFGKRPGEELYNLKTDPECLQNLANDAKYAPDRKRLADRMTRELEAQSDPRMFGHGEIFERYPSSYPPDRDFYERFMKGERPPSGWVNDTDFEKQPLERESVE